MKTARAEETIIVCGCGTSALSILPHVDKVTTIGVNDIGELFTPDYLVVIDSPLAFSEERRKTIENTDCALITQKQWNNEKQIYIQLKGEGVSELAERGRNNYVNHSRTSVYVATIIAYYLGAKKIGLLGVDFTDNHYNRQDGKHNLTDRVAEIDADFGRLARALRGYGCKLVNLSEQSRLKSLEKQSIEDFVQCVEKTKRASASN